jgi:hypothetical protein
MATIYSKVLGVDPYGLGGLAFGVPLYIAPPGIARAVLRDFSFSWLGLGPTDALYVQYRFNATGVGPTLDVPLAEVLTGSAAQGLVHWEGRQVLNVGDGIVASVALTGLWTPPVAKLVVNGYEFTS